MPVPELPVVGEALVGPETPVPGRTVLTGDPDDLEPLASGHLEIVISAL